jgi:hypothetical protein
MKFCASAGGGQELDKQFAALSLQTSTLLPSRPTAPASEIPSQESQEADTALPPLPAVLARKDGDVGKNEAVVKAGTKPSAELELILMAMRKLREAIVASRRHDTFAQRCYIFILRASILVSHWESYLPTLLYLIYDIHPLTPLPTHEFNECIIYYVLDLACRQSEFSLAYKVKVEYGIRDRRVEAVLKALVMDNWTVFWKVRRRVDGFQRAIMGWAEQGVRLHALKCLGRSYFTADKGFVEKAAGMEWEGLVGEGVGWELGNDGVVVIRRVKGK